MSTGDQTSYIRSKLEERNPRHHMRKPAQFMKDGFDRWAESTEPMRVGQMEKIAAEETKMASGGAMSFQDVLRYGQQAHQFGKTHGKTLKHVARTYGGEYGAKAADIATMLGYGAHGTHKGMPRKTARRAYEGLGGDGVSLAQVLEGVSRGHHLAKTHAPRAKAVARHVGVPKVAEAIEYLGYGGDGVSLQDVLHYGKQAHQFGKTHGSTIKKLARTYGGEYGAKAADVATMLGYGDGMGGDGSLMSAALWSRHHQKKARGGDGMLIPAAAAYAAHHMRKRKGNGDGMLIPAAAAYAAHHVRKHKKGGILPLAPALIAAAPYLASAATGIAAGVYGERGVQALKKKIARNYISEHSVGRGDGAKRKPSARNVIVRQVMAERGCSLPEASSIVKREGLY